MAAAAAARPALLMFLAGALLALAQAPFYFWPLIFISIPICFLLLERATTRRAAAKRGFFFGYGYFMAGTWWIANALLVDAAQFGWLVPFCVFGISAVLALYGALLGAAFFTIKGTHHAANLLLFTALWVGVEYIRSVGLFGFPWNLAGYIALASLKTAQLAAFIGTFGLSFLIIGIAGCPVLWPRWRRAALLIPALAIFAAYGYGALRLKAEALPATSARIRIVQPNIPQAIKTSGDWQMHALRVMAQSQSEVADEPVDITIWPETAYPFVIRSNHIAMLKPSAGILLTGAVRVEPGEGAAPRLYNSLIAANPAGLLLMAYDKHQLVPFGEFVPLRSVLPLEKITPGNIDFSRGEGPQTIILRDLPSFSPLICYEVIFPWMAAHPARRPEWLLNVTNDAWYGDSPGPYQHFAAAQMRAIEQGLPLARAANSGISALIDPYGRNVSRLELGQAGSLVAHIPAALPPTRYAKMGEGGIAALTILIILIFGRFGRMQ